MDGRESELSNRGAHSPCGYFSEMWRETLTSKVAGIALALPSLDSAIELSKQVAEAEQRSLARECIKTAEQF